MMQQLKATIMKQEQFKHNIAKHKRQMKQQREDDQLTRLFKDFGKIYSNTTKP